MSGRGHSGQAPSRIGLGCGAGEATSETESSPETRRESSGMGVTVPAQAAGPQAASPVLWRRGTVGVPVDGQRSLGTPVGHFDKAPGAA